MVLNVIFLAGGIGIGYLLRGEFDRRKNKQIMNTILDEGIKIAKQFVDTMDTSDKQDDYVVDDADEISFDGIADLFKSSEDNSNSTDETIKL